MCGRFTTNKKPTLISLVFGNAVIFIASSLFSGPATAAMEGILEEIVVTAQKREQALQDVPISVATVSGEEVSAIFAGSEDVLGLSARVPGLYAESSNGRAAPRFYLRGLGNIDFDLAASQPVSFIMDEVVMENVVLKGFPLFDIQNIEVIRGPQGTLFGRNTTAGIVKVNTRRPTQETEGYIKASYGTYGTSNIEGAAGGSLIDGSLSARGSVLHRTRDNWIYNGNTGQKAMGRYEESAGRVQVEWTPTDSFTALLLYQVRSMNGTSSIFRANVFTTGSNELNQNYVRDMVWYDGGDNNPQEYQNDGTTLNLQWDFDNASFTSITSYQTANGYSRGDIDGGVVNILSTPTPPEGITWADVDVLCPFPCLPARTWPGPIFTPSVTQDGADTDQFTQEFRLASNNDGAFNWQIGAFYFDSDLLVTTDSFASYAGNGDVQNTIVQQKNEPWAVFGQGSWDVTDALTLTAGVRYTDDEKNFQVLQFGALWLELGIPTFLAPPITVDDGQPSWEVAANFRMTDSSSLYARISTGFRAQTIQGRDVAFLETPTVANSETVDSFEAGYKADLFSDRLRLNVGLYHYEVNDMQLSIIGGASNTNQVINAELGEATGFEVDLDWLITENLLVSVGTAYADTEIKDPTLATVPCGSGLCTPLDPVDPSDPNRVLLDGNPFPRAPRTTTNFTLRYSTPVGDSSDARLYFFTDWAWTGKINMPLYEAIEFQTDNQFEGGIRLGYENLETGWEVAFYGRNITDENNVLGFVDFSNNTGFVNEPRMWGVEVGYNFGE